MRPLPDFTDDQWKGILQARSKFVNGQPDAKGAYEWLLSQPDAMPISQRLFEARVRAKLLEMNVPPRLRDITQPGASHGGGDSDLRVKSRCHWKLPVKPLPVAARQCHCD
jgi:hypothetical protein